MSPPLSSRGRGAINTMMESLVDYSCTVASVPTTYLMGKTTMESGPWWTSAVPCMVAGVPTTYLMRETTHAVLGRLQLYGGRCPDHLPHGGTMQHIESLVVLQLYGGRCPDHLPHGGNNTLNPW